MGSKIFEHNVPEEDAALVERLRGAWQAMIVVVDDRKGAVRWSSGILAKRG